ncbi:signal peptide peptidase SppA [Moraxella sp.]|uniref:signal peptide peptidase SppA n=1 Tax=Moraxella sp. TaxID=479 RepID=UPI0026DD8CD4|nr:signal peptide peptidase SppA [Moraxella sp.]MDO4894126.1 signal peptide peptidase SppA [Moraxella sp.]
MAWPPNPNKENPPQPLGGQEWQLIEKTLLASIEEQKTSRRWGVILRIITLAVWLILAVLLTRACSDSASVDKAGMSSPHLAVVEVNGVIGGNAREGVSAFEVSEALSEAFDNPNAKSVALVINSPGGSPVQSDEIWEAMMDLRKENPDKKLYAVIEDIGASGAYYIASAADEIWANPSSLVGSIGVIMSGYNVEELMKKVGVRDVTMTAGEYKDILSSSRPMTEKEKAHIQALLDATHQDFINSVKQGRGKKLKNPEENQLFSGLIWTGRQAVDLGLADRLGGMHQLKKQLDLPEVNYTYKDPMNQIFDRLGVQIGKGLGQGVQLSLSQAEQAQIQ